MSGGQVELLEWLVMQTGQSYVSDLRNDIRSHKLTRALRRALDGAPSDMWSAADWSGALHYLTGAEVRFSTVDEALAYVAAHM